MLFSDDLDQNAFRPLAVKLQVVNRMIGPEVEFASGDRTGYVVAGEDGAEMPGRVLFGVRVVVAVVGVFRHELVGQVQPVLGDARVRVRDENRGGGVERKNQRQPLLDPALL